MFSKLQSVDADSRRELKGSDQQSSMLSAVDKCNLVAVLGVPEIVVDVSMREIETILKMLEAVVATDGRSWRMADNFAHGHREMKAILRAQNPGTCYK